jgi:hypothetical protein
MTFLELQEDAVMRKLLKGVWWRLELMGRARAAAHLSYMGHHDAAKNLILDIDKYK